jgi:hypothetical protein
MKFLKGCKSSKQARKLAPWAAVVLKADGGYWAFESTADADQWRKQR